jgi:hypothetical protein
MFMFTFTFTFIFMLMFIHPSLKPVLSLSGYIRTSSIVGRVTLRLPRRFIAISGLHKICWNGTGFLGSIIQFGFWGEGGLKGV